ncbi:MAG TPA: C40 family peptidase, partial [Actinomycetota bacterium]
VLAQLGKPYHWGGAGPSSFDCSGLTMYSWAKAGVSMPHSAAAQYDLFPHVARSALQAGDLVFFGSPIHHVGLYIGQNLMVAAPSTGRLVQVQTLVGRSDYVGAARP